MQARHLFTSVVVLVGVFAGLIWFVGDDLWRDFFEDSATLNFDLYVQFEVDGEQYEGSSTWRMREWIVRFPTSGAYNSRVWGEAIALTGGPRRLFVLRKPVGGSSGTAYGDFPVDCAPSDLPVEVSLLDWLRNDFRGPCDVAQAPGIRLPILLEIPDWPSVQGIRELTYAVPTEGGICGPVCLRVLSVRRSDAPVTRGIDQVVPALATLEFGMTDVVTGDVKNWESESIGVPMLVDFSTAVGEGRMYP